MTISITDLTKLQRDVWSNRFVNGTVTGPQGPQPVLIRYRGGHTRDYPKKSYELRLNGRTYHLNAEYDDPSLIRNALSFRFFESIGVPAPYTRHTLLTINGSNHGVYLMVEAVKRIFFRRRGIAVRSLTYAVNDSADFSLIDPETNRRKKSLFDGYYQMIGGRQERLKLCRLVRAVNHLKGSKLRSCLLKHIDVDNYLRWLAGAVLTGNYDGFDQNYALYEHRPSGRYRIVPWDYEGTWGRNCFGRRVGADLVRITGYNQLTRQLLADREILGQYKRLLEKLLASTFTTNRIMPVVRRLHSRLIPEVYEDRMRKWPVSQFEAEPAVIAAYIEERRDIIARELNRL